MVCCKYCNLLQLLQLVFCNFPDFCYILYNCNILEIHLICNIHQEILNSMNMIITI